MALMLDMTEGTFVTFGDAGAGSLALLAGYAEGVDPLLVVGSGQERRALLLSAAREWALVNLDHRDQLLDLGPPVVRYDAASRRKKGEQAQAGDLVWVDGRFGLRAAGGYRSGMSGWETPVGWFDGTVSTQNYACEHHAFCGWAVGFMRGDEFVFIASTAWKASAGEEADKA